MIFKIIVDEDDSAKEFLQKYNEKNNTQFELIDIDYDEVTFFVIESNGSGNDEIIQLGIQYAKWEIINRIEN